MWQVFVFISLKFGLNTCQGIVTSKNGFHNFSASLNINFFVTDALPQYTFEQLTFKPQLMMMTSICEIQDVNLADNRIGMLVIAQHL